MERQLTSANYWLLCFPFWQSYFIKLFDAGLQCEFIQTFYPSNSNKEIEIFFFAIRLQSFSLIKLAAMKSQLVYNLNNVRRLIIKHMTKKRDFFLLASTPWFYYMIAIWWCNESVANTIWNWLSMSTNTYLSQWAKTGKIVQ